MLPKIFASLLKQSTVYRARSEHDTGAHETPSPKYEYKAQKQQMMSGISINDRAKFSINKVVDTFLL